MLNESKHVLIARDDKIGDFALTWPLFAIIKHHWPNAIIHTVVSENIATFANSCPYIDHVYSLTSGWQRIIEALASYRFQAFINYSSSESVQLLLKRLNTKTSVTNDANPNAANFTAHVHLKKDFARPAWLDAFEYAKAIGINNVSFDGITFPLWDVSSKRTHWRQSYDVLPEQKMIMVHPGSGGSSNVYSIDNYERALANLAHDQYLDNIVIYVSWHTSEFEHANSLYKRLKKRGFDIRLCPNISSVGRYAESLVAVDIMLACSTGPLHLASLHNAFTIGLYANKREVRWQTLSSPEKRCELSAPNAYIRSMRRNINRISPHRVSMALNQALLLSSAQVSSNEV